MKNKKLQTQAQFLKKLKDFCEYYKHEGQIYRVEFIVPDGEVHYLDGTVKKEDIQLHMNMPWKPILHITEVPFRGY